MIAISLARGEFATAAAFLIPVAGLFFWLGCQWARRLRHEAQVPNYVERHPRDETKPGTPLGRRLVDWIYS